MAAYVSGRTRADLPPGVQGADRARLCKARRLSLPPDRQGSAMTVTAPPMASIDPNTTPVTCPGCARAMSAEQLKRHLYDRWHKSYDCQRVVTSAMYERYCLENERQGWVLNHGWRH